MTPTEKQQHLRVLIVDDEPDVLDLLTYNLSSNGFDVSTAINGKDALEKANSVMPDIVLLDIMMPEMDGIETCTKLRSNRKFDNMIIVMLTARNEDYSQIAGLESGADDYITKPIKPKVLLSRINALTRRIKRDKSSKIEVDNIVLDPEQFLVFVSDRKVELPKKEFGLLQLLMSKPGKVFTRDNIMDNVWGTDASAGDRTIDVHIRKLREKLGGEYIKTVKGVGYKFESV